MLRGLMLHGAVENKQFEIDENIFLAPSGRACPLSSSNIAYN